MALGDLPNKPNALTLYQYWDDKLDSRALPSLQDINLIDLWRIAPALIIKDVIGCGADFRNRYWGTLIVERAGFDASGKTHWEIYKDQPLGPQMENYQHVVKDKCGNIVHRSSSFIENRDFVVFTSLNLPIGQTDDVVDHIISVIDYD